MWSKILINLYLLIHYYYSRIWHFIFSWIENFVIVYHVTEAEIKNITHKYYLKFGLEKYRNGTFYAKIYNSEGTNHFAFDGDVNLLRQTKLIETNENLPKRKQVVLLNNDVPVAINLQVLDNYKKNMKHSPKCITNLATILKMLKIECTHIAIIDFSPYRRKTIEVENVEIDHLYHN